MRTASSTSLACVIAAVLSAPRAHAEPDAPDHPRLTLGTTAGATISGGNAFIIGQLDLRAQIAHHARMVFALQASGPGTSCVDGACPTPYYFASLASIQYDVTRGFTRTITSASISPDGSRVVATGNGKPMVWDAQTGKVLASLDDDRVSRVRFSADGATIVALSNRAIRLHETP